MGSVRRGRPVGSKNKPKVKTVRLTNTQIALGKKLGVSPEQYAKSLIKIEKQEKASLARKKRASIKKVDWEKLSKELHESLKSQIKENEQHHKWCLEWREKFDKLEAEHKKEVEELNKQLHQSSIRAYKLKGIVEYLEDQIEHNSIRSN
jgi:predicted AAA+ superfamily ATPase